MRERVRFERETNNLGINERIFESPYYPNFENDRAISNALPSIPALMKSPETTPLQQTLYVNISLGMDVESGIDAKTGESKKYKVQPMTGIFIPQSLFRKMKLILFFIFTDTKPSRREMMPQLTIIGTSAKLNISPCAKK